MISRFQIEDLIIQDASGVVFRALDTESGDTVALRRFFPFGADGGGLHPDEQFAYKQAISRLAGIRHPALRSIISGGCDPVDGIPFIATEWINGNSLQSQLAQGAISADVVTDLITQLLEVSELLSHVLAEQAVWLETDTRTIIVSSPENGRGFTFWISPLKWLGGGNENKGLESIINLTEEAMGWKGLIVSDQAGRGLGGWLKDLRNTTTLQQARESLAASVGVEPPPPAKTPTAAASTTSISHTPSKSKNRLLVPLVLTLLIATISGAWFLFHDRSPEIPVVAENPKPMSAIERTNQRAAELSASTTKIQQKTSAIIAGQESAAKQRGGVIAWQDHQLLVENRGKTVTIEGIVRSIVPSSSGKTIYLLFSAKEDRDAARAGIGIDPANKNSTIASLTPHIGKSVRVSGTIDLQKVSGLNRPDIMIDDISAVKRVE